MNNFTLRLLLLSSFHASTGFSGIFEDVQELLPRFDNYYFEENVVAGDKYKVQEYRLNGDDCHVDVWYDPNFRKEERYVIQFKSNYVDPSLTWSTTLYIHKNYINLADSSYMPEKSILLKGITPRIGYYGEEQKDKYKFSVQLLPADRALLRMSVKSDNGFLNTLFSHETKRQCEVNLTPLDIKSGLPL